MTSPYTTTEVPKSANWRTHVALCGVHTTAVLTGVVYPIAQYMIMN